MSPDIYDPRPDTLPGRVMAYFRRLPDEELSVADIALKFGDDKNSINAKLKLAVENDALVRDGQVYSAGPKIGKAEAGAKLTEQPARARKPAASGFTSTRHALDFDALVVEEGVPAPVKGYNGGSKWDPLFSKLTKAGQSIGVHLSLKGALAAEAAKRNKLKHGTFKVAQTGADKARIWRMS